MAVEKGSDRHPAIHCALVVERQALLWSRIALSSLSELFLSGMNPITNLGKSIKWLNQSNIRLQGRPYHLEYSSQRNRKPRRIIRDDPSGREADDGNRA